MHPARRYKDGKSGLASRARLVGLIVALVGGGIIATAASLLPRRGGFGTHRQLGLGGCSFLARTGYPCPGCGITTSLAAMAHGQVVAAFRAQPFGVLLFVVLVAITACGAGQALSGRKLLGRFSPRAWWLWVAPAAWLLGWAVKVATGLAAGVYPLGR